MTGFKNVSNKKLVELARLLLQKGIEFCLYKFPGEKGYNIAVDRELNQIAKTEFLISPFTSQTGYREVTLKKIEDDKGYSLLIKKISKLAAEEIEYGVLPLATGKEEYLKKINSYLTGIKNSYVKKAILSRVKRVERSQKFDVFEFYENLCIRYPETFSHLFFLRGNGLWAGASPELLLHKEGKNYKTMALAGTLPINDSNNYQWRIKEEEEHDLVRQHIENTFAGNNCSLLISKGPFVFETGSVAHLRTDFTFREGINSNLSDILKTLHPTPAIGGLPVMEALELIEKTEGYNRSYYTGFLGEINGNKSARLFINLRCMQIGKKEIALYVGGGITADSNPEEEWNETEEKSNTLLKVIEDKAGKAEDRHENIR